MTRKKSLLIEVIIWGLLIFGIVSISSLTYGAKVKKNHTYYVFFKDIDGIIKGSPVKIQGVQVGYVSDIKFVNDEVFITFIITDRKFKMPSKMDASVSFTGMGGSKSLELFVPPEGEKAKNYIRTIEPMRLQDFMTYSNQTSQILVTMMHDAMKMMNDNTVKVVKEFINDPKALSDFDKTLDAVKKAEDNFLKQRRHDANKEE